MIDRNFLKSIEEALDFNKDISILDVGCGSGIWIVVSNRVYL